MTIIGKTALSLLPITVVIPVKNEEQNLPGCLEKLSRFSEIIVVDSSSEDSTPEIAKKYGARYVNFEWNGAYPKKRNWLLLNHTLENNWVLFLDADETVNDQFCNAVERAIKSQSHSGYWLNYSNYFLGRLMRFGVPQRKLALFKVDSGLYEFIQEKNWSRLDMEIHEHPIIKGSVGEISERIDHNDYRGITKFIDRHREYAHWEASRVAALNESNELAFSKLTKRQVFKYQNLAKWWYPWFYFLYAYVIRCGFLDGRTGLHYAFFKAWYFSTIQILISEAASQGKAASPPT